MREYHISISGIRFKDCLGLLASPFVTFWHQKAFQELVRVILI